MILLYYIFYKKTKHQIFPKSPLLKYLHLEQICDDLLGDQSPLAHALSFPQHSLGDGTILEAAQFRARAPQLTKFNRLPKETGNF